MLPSYPRLLQSVLIIGQTDYLLKPVANLLGRAGFDVSVLYQGDTLRPSSYMHSLHISKNDEVFFADIKNVLNQKFNLIVLTDDLVIDRILRSPLPDEIKTAVLPVNAKQYWGHLCSKNSLSQYLQKSKVLQPSFTISKTKSDLERMALALGFPLLLKVDFSGGGTGVFECANLEEVRVAKLPPDCFPLLLQKKIPGPVIDLSGFFYQGKLIHFSYSEFLNVERTSFSPSVVRKYSTRQSIDPKIADELNELGAALGLNGFANISCILSSEDGVRYYFEADVRPNVWVNFPYYLEDDPAKALNCFFTTQKIIPTKNTSLDGAVTEEIIPYIFRLSFLAILFNKYRVRNYCQEYSIAEVGRYIFGLIKSEFVQIQAVSIRAYKVLKQWLYHQPVHLIETTLIVYVHPRLPSNLAIQLTHYYKKLKVLGRRKGW